MFGSSDKFSVTLLEVFFIMISSRLLELRENPKACSKFFFIVVIITKDTRAELGFWDCGSRNNRDGLSYAGCDL